MKSKALKIVAGTLACVMMAGVVAGCGGATGVYDNENDAVVFSTQPLDGVFSPFFATTGTDMSVTGLTQISMLANDENGNVAYGEKEAVVVKDMEISTTGVGDDAITEYKFVLKNNIRFSNGSYLSMKDVLFNLYVYLDPVYTGASTIYSTDIVGLKAYRTQKPDTDEAQQDSFMAEFQNAARTRINALIEAKEEVDKDGVMDKDQFRTALQGLTGDAYAHVVSDYDKALELFREELGDDFSAALDSYADTVFQDSKGAEHRNVLQSDVEMFLYNEGVLTWNKETAQMVSGTVGPEYFRAWTKDQAINYVFDINIPGKIDEVVSNWLTAANLFTYITNEALEEYFQENDDRAFPNITGITFANKDAACTVNNTEYKVPEYEDEAHTHVKDGFNEVLSIKIHKIDPKAIWNFGFTVAPMYYYSDEKRINAFDYETNFGVEYASQSFLDDVVGSHDKNSLPVGAGPYAVSCDAGGVGKVAGGTAEVRDGDFYNGSMVYYERNPYFNADGKGPAKIKKVRYSVAQQNQMLNNLYAGDMDFVEPNAKTEIFNEVRNKGKDGIGNKEIQTSGYGYVGINAGKVPNLRVRQAIMHCIDVKLTAQYYGSHAEVLYRSMTKANWVYQKALKDKTSYYPFIGDPIPDDLDSVSPAYAHYVRDILHKGTGDKLTEEEQKGFIQALVAGIKGDPILSEQKYSLNARGVYQNTSGSDTLKYTFTIVGSEQDHPAWDALWQAGEMLNKWGFEINVKTDPQGLIKLNTGSLTVWAAAWGSTIDPDMYQVYHKDSTATSVLNWGYRQILQNAGGKYNYEYDLVVNELSPLIEQAREIDDSTEQGKQDRADLYAEALDLVMELAVELPTYQRNDLFVYNANKFDVNTFFQNATPFKGLTSDIHTVSLNVAQ